MRALILEEFGGPFILKDVATPRIGQPIVDRIFPMEDIELAFDALRQGRSLGRNVVAIG